MDDEREGTKPKTYSGRGTFDSPFEKLQGITIHEFAEEAWREHGQEIKKGESIFLSVGRFRYLVAGNPDETELPFQLIIDWEGFNHNFRVTNPNAPRLSAERIIRSAVDITTILYRRFLNLHIKESSGL